MAKLLLDLLAHNSLLLLFLITGVGYLVGRVRIGSFSFGVAAILFTGLGVGAIHPSLQLPSFLYQLGLVLFVYTLGLASGPALFSSFKRRGLRDTLFAVGSLIGAAGITLLLGRMFGLSGPILGGVFAGSLSSTPAMAGVLDFISTRAVESSDMGSLLAQPVVGYSLTYPIGVIGVMVTMHLLAMFWKVDFQAEREQMGDGSSDRMVREDIQVTVPHVVGQPIRSLFPRKKSRVVLSRLLRGDQQMTVDGDTTLQLGDIVTVVGPKEEIRRFTPTVGQVSTVQPRLDRSQVDVRSVFLSNRDVAGRRLNELGLHQRFGATVSRIRRGDVDLVATGDSILELGDQLQVVAPTNRLNELGDFFGDSFKHLGEIDVIPISIGIALGLLLGMVPIPFLGGITIRLGFAGGPLLVALILGTIGRTKHLVWILPYHANLTLRQVGLVLFLAAIGTQAGNAIGSTLSGIGLSVIAAGVLITILYSSITLFIGYKVLKIPMTLLFGILPGIQTQSATLAFANDRTGNELPNIGYATVYPTAMVVKILLAQVLVSLFGLT